MSGNRSTIRVGITVLVGLSTSLPAHSLQTFEDFPPSDRPATLLPVPEMGGVNRAAPPLLLADVNDPATQAILADIDAVERECASLPVEYRVDCLGDGLKWVAGRIPRGEYDQARTIINQAASRLNQIAQQNADPAKAALEPKPASSQRWRARRSYVAIRAAALSAANAAAVGVVREAETRLLRSAEASSRRLAHYSKISASIGSTKRLLRSA